MKGPVVFTSANLAYLDRALVLLDSLRKHEPTLGVALVLVDEMPSDPISRQLLERFDDVILARDLGIPEFERWVYGHAVVEACTAVKGAALQVLLDRGHPYVIYLDPDIACFAPLDVVRAEMERGSILLTPHQVDPEPEDWAVRDNEVTSLRTGTFNFGFVGVRNDASGRAFATWWASRLMRYCVDDVSEGLFTDQRWGDLVPAMFDQTVVVRDRGSNVASWNLLRRPVTFSQSGVILAAGEVLSFFHFSKAKGIGEAMTLKHSRGSLPVAALWRWYLEQLREYTRILPRQQWSYASYDDGTQIEGWHRRLYRDRKDLQASYPDPFATYGGPSLLGWLRLYETGAAT